ncbi:aldehyde dehydrogenase family protein [Pseudalkalibacillus decolorationis]|uniref:aldehyde dehydrogenase family protein n=1 Tax=Pseudalkalibacillus decolorationis TaxID=163879 RepID=UPI002147F6EB|nr:aldehyde dehydrogenase family protein [Pseudalkalibacillus decolorationis]
MGTKNHLYINGKWTSAFDGGEMPVHNPSTGEEIEVVSAGNHKDAEASITAARMAFDQGKWKEFSANRRAGLLLKLADQIEGHTDEFASIETQNNGKTLRESKFDVAEAVKTFRYYAGLATKPLGETFELDSPMTGKVVREPVGVCAQIIPWNYPLLMASWKLAPALAAGNTCILKPSEMTPLSAIRLFELIDGLDFPPGVVNLLLGFGEAVGQPLAKSPLVDKVAFTGGTVTGKKIMQYAADNLKKVSLELGGKSPNIVFADADFETAVDYAMFAIFNNSGQVCSAGSRLLVEESIYDQFQEAIIERTQRIRVGSGFDASSQMGPLISPQHLSKVQGYITLGEEEGGKVCCGGKRLVENDLKKGNFIEPTIFINVKPEMRIAQEEIFGPVLCLIPFNTEAEAIEIANGTPYGLAAGIFTTDGAKAERVARSIRAGITWINTYEQNFVEAPWGGYKQSGLGRELGTYGLEEYMEVKQIINNLEVEPTGWFD